MIESCILFDHSFGLFRSILQFINNYKLNLQKEFYPNNKICTHIAFLYKNNFDQFVFLETAFGIGTYRLSLEEYQKYLYKTIMYAIPLNNDKYEFIKNEDIGKFEEFFNENYSGCSILPVNDKIFDDNFYEEIILDKEDSAVCDLHSEHYRELRRNLINNSIQNIWNDFATSFKKNTNNLSEIFDNHFKVEKNILNKKVYPHCSSLILDLIKSWCVKQNIDLPLILQSPDIKDKKNDDIYPQELFNSVQKYFPNDILSIDDILGKKQ